MTSPCLMSVAPGEGAWLGEAGMHPFPGLFLSCPKTAALHPMTPRAALSCQTPSKSSLPLLLAAMMANICGYLSCAKLGTLFYFILALKQF